MLALPKPELILTHESDLDGLLAGLLLQRLARKMFGFAPSLEAYHYDNWRQRPLRETAAWVADFNFDARMDRPNWLVVDHHPTETPAKSALLIHDTSKSASLLCYELCQEQGLGTPELDRLIHLSNIADLFLEDDPDFLLATEYANLVKCYSFWNLHALIDGQIERLANHPLLEVMAVKRRVEDPLGYEWSKAHVTPLAPTVGYVDTVIGNTNLIVHQLLVNQAAPYAVLITLFRKGNGVVIASLRSRNGEALQVALSLKGGGHPNAAGATLPRSVQRIPDAVDYLRKILNPASNLRTPEPFNSLESVFDALEQH
jgi:oligoribonuclease NrnB/cAMP/cGMP phosphodiesterase (DHH superfamily)